MDQYLVDRFVYDLLVILTAGFVSGAVCRRLGVSMLVGYLVIGALLGSGLFDWLRSRTHELDYLAEVGVLLLLFSIGIEFSLEDLVRISRTSLLGGTTQMILVAVPIAVTCVLFDLSWQSAALLGAAAAFSSTVLVFKALGEWGQTTSPHGRRAIAILLFQDAAVVPLVLLVPLLTGNLSRTAGASLLMLAVKSLLLLAAVPVGRWVIARWVAPWLGRTRSVELLVLFTIIVLGGAAMGAYQLGLPPMIGAFGAGLMLNGNRLTRQIDAVVLPFRETFAAVFFVSLGTLIRFDALLAMPVTCISALVAVLVLKTAAGTIALRITGLPWTTALGTGLGLAQIGEFAFVLLMAGLSQSVIGPQGYNLMMFVAVVTLIVTPQLTKIGLRLAERGSTPEREIAIRPASARDHIPRAVIVGIGPIGSQTASQLETKGYDVCLIDLSPINLHPFAQEGFRTVAGDAADGSVLERADVRHSSLVAVTVPHDRDAMRIVAAVRRVEPKAIVLVRCRFRSSLDKLRALGATDVFSEEVEVAGKLSTWLQRLD